MMRPVYCHAEQSSFVVAADNPQQASPGRQLIEITPKTGFTYAVICHDRKGFVGRVDNNGQPIQGPQPAVRSVSRTESV